ncbi:MAG: hypothetical protein EOO88_18335 [Pedobacter sp.]|nr:MAG: hypothetical protein EOO88_18335 [Pedobacter sp.]
MKTNRGARSLILVLALSTAAGIVSCKKTKTTDPISPPVSPPTSGGGTGSRADLTRDSIFLYAKQVYLWNDALPTYEAFNPSKYTTGSTDLANYNSELFAISQLKINPATSLPYEYRTDAPTVAKYSRIEDIGNKNPVAMIAPVNSVNTDGIGYDLGFLTFKAYGTNTNFRLYVAAVSPGSSAASKGLTRGAQITNINGTAIGSDFGSQSALINTLLGNAITSAAVGGLRTDGTAFSETLTRTSYTSSPVYKSKVFTQGGKKIGYMAFARFSSLTNSGSDTNLDPVFADFATQGVTDLIVDLRYNGGGFVSTAEYLINLIAPSSATGTMYIEKYNALMQSNSATILSNQPLTDANGKVRYGTDGKMLTYANVNYSQASNTAVFSKKGSLRNATNIVFIVSGNTASASELTINALRPFMNVKLVGTQTYGKPVGFFPIRMENKYDVYYSMFETVNSRGEGSYYAGFTPDIVDTFDDASRDFSDAQENYVAKALNLLAPTAVAATRSASADPFRTTATSSASTQMIGKIASPSGLIGMVETRHTLK